MVKCGADKHNPSRLPRLYPKAPSIEQQQPYYPASGVLGFLRRALTRDIMRHLPAQSMPGETYYLLAAGGAEAFAGGTVDVGALQKLRGTNPVESAFGSFRIGSRFGAGNLYPLDRNIVPPFVGGVRVNDAVRTPEIISQFDENSRRRIEARLFLDRTHSSNKKEIDKQIKELKKEIDAAKKAGNDELASVKLTAVREAENSKKTGHTPIQNLYMGYEYFPAGTAFEHRMSLYGASQNELAVVLAALRAGASMPRLGGHWHHDCGWVHMHYQVKVKPVHDYNPATLVGSVVMSDSEGFVLEENGGSTLLSDALASYDMQAERGFPEWPGVRENSELKMLDVAVGGTED
ncbi:hypothetical protein BW247_05635 [Acidihalobacter ferrooxydans]|uniref:Uncharacterized protein n=2 Tax=Acidihalobacter ferrooxydans TaxID=1765967 RepID=A0A1P8UFM1_9GAMM|nr:hypothetical protein BW247_05635 [Acidihalobacter ferrooxydans]